MEQEVALILSLLTAYLLDLALGDPRWVPHPIRLYGWLIARGEQRLNRGSLRFWKGAALGLLLVAGVFTILWLLLGYLAELSLPAWFLLNSLLLFFALANRSLIEEGRAVFGALEKEGLEAGRKRLSWIVGRETKNLSPQQIRGAVFETMSENLSDGVVAPLFYFALFGVPGAMAYKMVNTLDSMIGYKSERYEQFGKFAARLDDVCDYLPARITALLMLLVSGRPAAFRSIWKFGQKHASPNAGYPEAALAGILNCRFGGPNVYHGMLVEKPYIGEQSRSLEQADFQKVAAINQAVTLLVVMLICTIYWLW
jgi:adenosylcobinamide-phosphate synthase